MKQVPDWLLYFLVDYQFWLMPSPLLSPMSNTAASNQEMLTVWPDIWNLERKPSWCIHLNEYQRSSKFSAYAKNADHKLLYLVFHLFNTKHSNHNIITELNKWFQTGFTTVFDLQGGWRRFNPPTAWGRPPHWNLTDLKGSKSNWTKRGASLADYLCPNV